MGQPTAERLQSVLLDERFRQGLYKVLKYVRGELQHGDFPLKPRMRRGSDISGLLEILGNPFWKKPIERHEVRLEVIAELQSLRLSGAASDALARLLEDEIIPHTGLPPILTREDLLESACLHLLVHESELDDAYYAFVRSLIGKVVSATVSDRFLVARAVGDITLSEVEENDVLWSNESFRILLKCASLQSECDLWAQVEGEATRRAVERVCADAKYLVPSLADSDNLLTGDGDGGHPEYSLDLPRQALQLQFGPEDESDSLAHCLKNAIWFLAEADHQHNQAIAFVACFAAVEAMVGGGADIAKVVSENTAVVLEADPQERLKAAKRIKRLYGMRCDYVHGTDPREAGAYLECVP